MKKILYSILAVFGISSCDLFQSPDKVFNCENLDNKNGVWYFDDQPYSGDCNSFHPNGNLKSECSFKNGLIHGELKMFYINGTLEEVIEYGDNVPNGRVFYYFENGKIKEEGSLVQGEKQGEWKAYFSNGKINRIDSFKEGKLHGKVIAYTESGSKEVEGYFENGIEEGVWKFYNPETGELDGEMQYENGKPKKVESKTTGNKGYNPLL